MVHSLWSIGTLKYMYVVVWYVVVCQPLILSRKSQKFTVKRAWKSKYRHFIIMKSTTDLTFQGLPRWISYRWSYRDPIEINAYNNPCIKRFSSSSSWFCNSLTFWQQSLFSERFLFEYRMWSEWNRKIIKMAFHYYGGLSGEKAWKINRPKYYGYHLYIIKIISSTSKLTK